MRDREWDRMCPADSIEHECKIFVKHLFNRLTTPDVHYIIRITTAYFVVLARVHRVKKAWAFRGHFS